MSVSLVALLCRTSDRTPRAARGAAELAPLVGDELGVDARIVGTPGDAVARRFDEDLKASRGCLLEAGGQVDDALSAGNVPLLLAAECSIAITTLPTVHRHRPEARVLWLDAHGDFNSPDTSGSGFLGGMALSGACGVWDPGLGVEPLAPERVVLAGVRDLDAGERELLERSAVTVVGASLETLVYVQNALDRAPVYVHLDLDVLDPGDYPAWIPASGGLPADKLYDLLEAVAGECELVGAEIVPTQGPVDPLETQAATSTVLHAMEPLVAALAREEAPVGD